PNLHACIGTHQFRNELVASDCDHLTWEHNCSCAYTAQFASRHQVRYSISCLRSCKLRHCQLKPAGSDARPGCVRLVWHSSLDRRSGSARSLSYDFTELANSTGWTNSMAGHYSRLFANRVHLVPALLGLEHLHCLPRHGSAAQGRKLG